MNQVTDPPGQTAARGHSYDLRADVAGIDPTTASGGSGACR